MSYIYSIRMHIKLAQSPEDNKRFIKLNKTETLSWEHMNIRKQIDKMIKFNNL